MDSEYTIDRNNFSNFEVGIISTRLFNPVTQVIPSFIYFNTFEKNNIGIFNSAMPLNIHYNTFDLSDIYFSTSTVPDVSLIMADNYARFGIFATSNTQFLNIYGNTVENSSISSTFPQVTRTGVYIQNLGSSSMIIERQNAFFNLSYGNIAEGINNGMGQSGTLQTGAFQIVAKPPWQVNF